MSRASNAASPGFREARDDAPLEKFQNLHAAGTRRRDGLVVGRVRPDEMIDRRACRGLAAFVEPESGNHARIVGTPDARNEARLGRRRHDAGRGSHDVGEPAAHIDRTARLSRVRRSCRRLRRGRRSATRRPACPRADRNRARPISVRPAPSGGAGCDDLLSDFRVAIRSEISKTDALEIAAAPAPFVGEKIPLAGERAHRARRRAGGPKRQIVGEIEEMAGADR